MTGRTALRVTDNTTEEVPHEEMRRLPMGADTSQLAACQTYFVRAHYSMCDPCTHARTWSRQYISGCRDYRLTNPETAT